MDHKTMSKKGGQAKSEAKTKAARKNAKKPRGCRITAIAYCYDCKESQYERMGVAIIKGKVKDESDEAIWELINEYCPEENKYTLVEFLDIVIKSVVI